MNRIFRQVVIAAVIVLGFLGAGYALDPVMPAGTATGTVAGSLSPDHKGTEVGRLRVELDTGDVVLARHEGSVRPAEGSRVTLSVMRGRLFGRMRYTLVSAAGDNSGE